MKHWQFYVEHPRFPKSLIGDRSTENLPEGIIKTDYSLDGAVIRLVYTKEKQYHIKNLMFHITSCADLHQAEIFSRVLSYCYSRDWRKALKIARQIDRQVKPLWDSLFSSVGWISEEARIKYVVNKTIDKLEALESANTV